MSIGTHTKLAHVSCLNNSFKKYSIHLLIIPVCTVFFFTQDKVQKPKVYFVFDKGPTCRICYLKEQFDRKLVPLFLCCWMDAAVARGIMSVHWSICLSVRARNALNTKI